MKRKIFSALLVLSLSVALLAGCSQTTTTTTNPPEEKEPFKIGAILSLTGDYAGLGVPEKNALDLEVKKINDAGGINGSKIEMIIEDDATDPGKTVSAASKLITQDKVLCIIGATGTGQSMAIAKDIEKAQIPDVCLAGGSVVSEPVQKWVFQIPWPNRIVVPKVIDYLKSKSVDRVAILTSSDGFGKDGKAVLEAQLPKSDIAIVANETIDPKGLDFKSQLTKIKDTDAKALVVWNAGKAASIVAKNMKELDISIPFIGSHGNARKEFIEGAGEAAEGAVIPAGRLLIPSSYTDPAQKDEADKFIKDYTAAYKEAPNGTFPGHAYDGLYVAVRALERLNKSPKEVTGVALRDEIEKTKDIALLGGIFTYSPTDHAGTQPGDLILAKVEGGKWVEIK